MDKVVSGKLSCTWLGLVFLVSLYFTFITDFHFYFQNILTLTLFSKVSLVAMLGQDFPLVVLVNNMDFLGVSLSSLDELWSQICPRLIK